MWRSGTRGESQLTTFVELALEYSELVQAGTWIVATCLHASLSRQHSDGHAAVQLFRLTFSLPLLLSLTCSPPHTLHTRLQTAQTPPLTMLLLRLCVAAAALVVAEGGAHYPTGKCDAPLEGIQITIRSATRATIDWNNPNCNVPGGKPDCGWVKTIDECCAACQSITNCTTPPPPPHARGDLVCWLPFRPCCPVALCVRR